MRQYVLISFLLLTVNACFCMHADRGAASPKGHALESLQKATVRPKEQAKFIKSFQENPAAFEALGLFSYGGFADDGQIKILLLSHEILIKKAKPVAMSGAPAARDGNLIYKSQKIQVKNPHWTGFHSSLEKDAKKLKNFHTTHFDGRSYEFLHLKKERSGKTHGKRLYFDDPYLKDNLVTKELKKLLSNMREFIKKVQE